MRLYEYIPDSNHYGSLRLLEKDRDLIKIRSVHEPLVGQWEAPTLVWSEGSGTRECDFPSLSDYNHIPIMSQRAWEKLRPLIGHNAEALPIIHPSGKPYYLIHIIKPLDCLDVDHAEVRYHSVGGGIASIIRFAFHEDRLRGHHLLKLPREHSGITLVDDEFRRAVEDNGLKGLLFIPVLMVGDPDPEPPPPPPPGTRYEGTLTIEEEESIGEHIEYGNRVLLGGRDDVPPDQVQEIVYEELERLRSRLHEYTSEEIESIALALGCLWGEAICRQLDWHWGPIMVDEERAVAVISPYGSLVAYPFSLVYDILTDPERDNNALLLYNMLKAGKFKAEPYTYEVVS